jgi:hypothetical protein
MPSYVRKEVLCAEHILSCLARHIRPKEAVARPLSICDRKLPEVLFLGFCWGKGDIGFFAR